MNNKPLNVLLFKKSHFVWKNIKLFMDIFTEDNLYISKDVSNDNRSMTEKVIK